MESCWVDHIIHMHRGVFLTYAASYSFSQSVCTCPHCFESYAFFFFNCWFRICFSFCSIEQVFNFFQTIFFIVSYFQFSFFFKFFVCYLLFKLETKWIFMVCYFLTSSYLILYYISLFYLFLMITITPLPFSLISLWQQSDPIHYGWN